MGLRSFKHHISFGVDPEAFYTKDGDVVSSDQVLPKQEEASRKSGIKVYSDGVQAEYNTRGATGCRESITSSIASGNSKLIKTAKSENLGVSFDPAVELPAEQVRGLSDFARRFGCDPAKGAWLEGKELDAPSGEEHPVRYAGGHIHLGEKKSRANFLHNSKKCNDYVKVLDYYIGIPLTYLNGGPTQKLRRRGYGKAGAYRDTSYGVEYRTPSSLWIQRPALAGFIFAQAREAASAYEAFGLEKILKIANPPDVIEAINEADREAAAKIWREVKKFQMSYVRESHCTSKYFKSFDLMAAMGLDTFAEPTDSKWWGGFSGDVRRHARHRLNIDPNADHSHDKIYLEEDDFKTKVAA